MLWFVVAECLCSSLVVRLRRRLDCVLTCLVRSGCSKAIGAQVTDDAKSGKELPRMLMPAAIFPSHMPIANSLQRPNFTAESFTR